MVLALGAGLAWLAHGLAWLLLLAGPRPVLELALTRRHATTGSDAAQLARLTHVPGMVWIAVWLAGTVGALAWGTALMLPGLLPGIG